MRRKNYNIMFLIIGVLIFVMIGLMVAYAALSSTLNVSSGQVSQDALTWNVGFNTGTVYGQATGTDTTSIQCGTATATATTVSGIDVSLSRVGDKCSYYFYIANNGTIAAKINSITPKMPTDVSCSEANGSTMVCGDITYKLRYDSPDGTVQPAVGDVLSANGGLKRVFLTAEYTGSTVTDDDFFQSGFAFTIQYGQN